MSISLKSLDTRVTALEQVSSVMVFGEKFRYKKFTDVYSFNRDYANSTGFPMAIFGYESGSSHKGLGLVVDGQGIGILSGSMDYDSSFGGIVPSGSTFRVNCSSSSGANVYVLSKFL